MDAQRQQHLSGATENTTPFFFSVEDCQGFQHRYGLSAQPTIYKIMKNHEILLSV
jgi:hypothetical protein